MEKELEWFKENLNHEQIHGQNIAAKLKRYSKLSLELKRQLNNVIRIYKNWKENNEDLSGHTDEIIKERVKWLNEYKNKVATVKFSAQSKFHSTINEEFLYYLFKDVLAELVHENNNKIMLGGTRAYSNLYFSPENLSEFIKTPSMKINVKDQDFSIYRTITIKADNEKQIINVPVVSIECKTYLDKTMLEGAIATAEKIKTGNPYCIFLVFTEWYDVSYKVDPAYSRIDQIYVVRKEKRRGKINKDISLKVIMDFFDHVENHLTRNWSNIKYKLVEEGKII